MKLLDLTNKYSSILTENGIPLHKVLQDPASVFTQDTVSNIKAILLPHIEQKTFLLHTDCDPLDVAGFLARPYIFKLAQSSHNITKPFLGIKYLAPMDFTSMVERINLGYERIDNYIKLYIIGPIETNTHNNYSNKGQFQVHLSEFVRSCIARSTHVVLCGNVSKAIPQLRDLLKQGKQL